MNDTASPAPAAAKRSHGPSRKKVPAFARYEGTSAWKKYRRRVRAYAAFKAEQATTVQSA